MINRRVSMKKNVLLFIVGIIFTMFVACVKQESNMVKNQEDDISNKGTITFTNIEKVKLEEYYDDDYWVFILYVDEKNGMSRKEIYNKFLGSKFDEPSYLGSGLIVGTAKEILDLQAVEGLDITLTEFVYENCFIDREYIANFEAEKDNVMVHLDGIKPSEADMILDNYEVIGVIEDYLYDDINSEYIILNVNKDELQELFENDIVIGMRKRLLIGNNKQFARINEYIDNSEDAWPEK